jgi:hypothetical protein
MREIVKGDWFDALVDEISAIFVEHEFDARWRIIEGHHEVGKLLKETSDKYEVGITELVNRCAVALEVSERKLWYSVKFFDKFPSLEKLPEGKNTSFSQIRKKYLTEGVEKVEERYTICPKCGYKIK